MTIFFFLAQVICQFQRAGVDANYESFPAAVSCPNVGVFLRT